MLEFRVVLAQVVAGTALAIGCLISRGSSLPFVLVLLGVLGGILAFGFVGIFLGPTLLAVGFRFVRR